MVIVYGTRSGGSDTRLPHPCNNCRQPALVQSDWYQYLHVMFVPTFPTGSGRTVHCEACNNSYEMKGSAPIWTFLGSMLFVLCLLGGGAYEALIHLDLHPSSASITSVASAPSATVPAPAATSPSTPSPKQPLSKSFSRRTCGRPPRHRPDWPVLLLPASWAKWRYLRVGLRRP